MADANSWYPIDHPASKQNTQPAMSTFAKFKTATKHSATGQAKLAYLDVYNRSLDIKAAQDWSFVDLYDLAQQINPSVVLEYILRCEHNRVVWTPKCKA